MALASQTLLCQQALAAIPTCSTSSSSSLKCKSSCAFTRRSNPISVSLLAHESVMDSERKSRRWAGTASATNGTQGGFTAKELERDAAKEALLLAISDAGGVDALMSDKEDAVGRINVNEKLLVLERLNPTPRPTTSPLLEGLWQFKWAGARSPGVMAARTLLRRFPATLASIKSLDILILDGTTKATANLKLLNVVETTFTLSTKLTAEGSTRLKEEYVEGGFSSPNVSNGSLPQQMKGLYGQLVGTVERLPTYVKELVKNGVKVPLAGTYQRQLLVSYLDDEILIARDESGIPDVLYKIQPAIPIIETVVTVVPEYNSFLSHETAQRTSIL